MVKFNHRVFILVRSMVVLRHVTLGFEWYLMRVNSRINFAPEESREEMESLILFVRHE